MRKWLLLTLIVLSGLMFYVEPFRSAPPKPEVTAKGVSLDTTNGSYCWHSLLRGQCVDYVYKTPLEMTAKQTPTRVEPGTNIRITYSDGPSPSQVKVEEWWASGEHRTVKRTKEQLTVPVKKGRYTYHVSSRWDKGDGNVAFLIEVM